MMSISKMGVGADAYYLRIAREDYYSAGEEPPGEWFGLGARSIGLSGFVTSQELKSLFGGLHPESGERLVQSAGRATHQCGWDLTLSAPKSVSVLWGLGDEGTRHSVEGCQRAAVHAALSFLEEETLFTRCGHAGASGLSRVGGVFAVFQHGTSRNQDPLLHSHCLLLNIGVREDGSTSALDSRPVYEAKMAAGALYRAELAARLEQELGLKTERDGTSFRLKDIPKSICQHFSSRRHQIESYLRQTGESGAKASERAALLTRSSKRQLPREQLHDHWRERGQQLNYVEPEPSHLMGHGQERPDVLAHVHQSIDQVLKHDSVFSGLDIVRDVMTWSQGNGVDVSLTRQIIKSELSTEQYIPVQGRRQGRYARKPSEGLENEVRSRAQECMKNEAGLCSEGTLSRVQEKHGFLREDKNDALRYLTREATGLAVVSGRAGSGKTSLLAAAREVWEAEGYTVVGAAATVAGARELQDLAGIGSQTTTTLIKGLESTFIDGAIHHTKQILREAMGKRGYKRQVPKLNSSTILVVDQAGMLTYEQTACLMSHAAKHASKIVLVGDPNERPFHGESPFEAISEIAQGPYLGRNIRQVNSPERDAVDDFSLGGTKEALQTLDEHGKVVVNRDREALKRTLVHDFLSVPARESKQILAGNQRDAAEFNRLVQKARMEDGQLGMSFLYGDGGDRLHVGDSVVFDRGNRLFDISKGAAGTVAEARMLSQELVVRLDDNRKLTIPFSRFNHVSLGYASVRPSQTYDRGFIYLGGSGRSDELLYSQVSRVRTEARVYASAQLAPGRESQPAHDLSPHQDLEMSVDAGWEIS